MVVAMAMIVVVVVVVVMLVLVLVMMPVIVMVPGMMIMIGASSGRSPLFKVGPLAKKHSLGSVPGLAPSLDPALQCGSGNAIDAAVRHDFEYGEKCRDRQQASMAGLCFRLRGIQVRRVISAGGKDVQAVPLARVVRQRDGAPSVRHGAILIIKRT